MRLFKKAKETMETQENRPVMQHDLPKNYNGAYKLLGKNVKTPIEPAAGTNTLVLGPPASGKTFSYVYSNLKKANDHSNFLIYTVKADSKQYKKMLPYHTVIEIDISKRQLDYISLITNTDEAARFFDILYKASVSAIGDNWGGDMPYTLEDEKELFVRAVQYSFETGGCSYEQILKEITDVAEQDDRFTEAVVTGLQTLLYQVKPADQTKCYITDIIDFLRTAKNTAIILFGTCYLYADLYVAIFLDQFVNQYKKQCFINPEIPNIVRLIIDEAPTCYCDFHLLTVVTGRIRISVDFIYQDVSQIKRMYPDVWGEIEQYGITRYFQNIICFGVPLYETVKFIKDTAELPADFDFHLLSRKQELLFGPETDYKWAVIDKPEACGE
jgi:hypothetical protein